MNDKIKQHLTAVAQKNNWPTDNDTLIEILTGTNEVYVKKVSDSRWWYTEFIVADVDGMLIGYEYAKANRDEHVRELGWEFDERTICEVEAVQETVTVYKKLNPAKGAVTNTMEPNSKQQEEQVSNDVQQATEQQNAQESAAQDQAVEVDSEEGGAEG